MPSDDTELAVGVGQVCLDGLGRDEQGLGDFGVGQGRGCQVGDSPFGGCERAEAGEGGTSRPRAEAVQLATCPVDQCRCAQRVGLCVATAERGQGCGVVTCVSLGCAEVDQRGGVFEQRRTALQNVERLGEC